MKSLDTYVIQPSGKKEYLQNYGYHFSKKACEYAVSLMKKRDNSEVAMCTRAEFDRMMNKYAMHLDNDAGYDALYVLAMAKADYWGSSIEDEVHLVRFVKDFIDDPDGGEEKAFRHWYADMIESGTPVIWEDII